MMNRTAKHTLAYATKKVAKAMEAKMTGSIEFHLKEGEILKVHTTDVERPKPCTCKLGDGDFYYLRHDGTKQKVIR